MWNTSQPNSVDEILVTHFQRNIVMGKSLPSRIFSCGTVYKLHMSNTSICTKYAYEIHLRCKHSWKYNFLNLSGWEYYCTCSNQYFFKKKLTKEAKIIQSAIVW